MAVSTATIISDTVLFLRNYLCNNITDPINRRDKDKWILTSYPKRAVSYPTITIKNSGLEFSERLGMNQEKYLVTLDLEIRVWARNEIERDSLSQSIITYLNSNQFPYTTTSTSSNMELHDLRVNNVIDIDEIKGIGGATQTVLSKIISITYKYLYGFN